MVAPAANFAAITLPENLKQFPEPRLLYLQAVGYLTKPGSEECYYIWIASQLNYFFVPWMYFNILGILSYGQKQ